MHEMTAVVPKQVHILRRTRIMKQGGLNRRGRVKLHPVRIVQLSCADTHCAALDVDGRVWTWGAAAALGRRCQRMKTMTSAVKKEPRGGASIYVVPYYLPPQAWDPTPGVVRRLRRYPVGRAISVAAGKGFTVVATARREDNESRGIQSVSELGRFAEGGALNLGHKQAVAAQFPHKNNDAIVSAAKEGATLSSSASEIEIEEGDEELNTLGLMRRQQEEAEEDRLIDQIGLRQLDERGDLILDVAAHEMQQVAAQKRKQMVRMKKRAKKRAEREASAAKHNSSRTVATTKYCFSDGDASDRTSSSESESEAELFGGRDPADPAPDLDDDNDDSKFNKDVFSLDVRAAAFGCADEQTEVHALSTIRRRPQAQHFRECVLMGKGALLRLLLLGGADPEQTFAHMGRKRVSALHHVCRANFANCVEPLLYFGADVNRRDEHGFTPLALAVIHRSVDAMNVLLRCRRYRRAMGLALVYCCRWGREDVLKQLIEQSGERCGIAASMSDQTDTGRADLPIRVGAAGAEDGAKQKADRREELSIGWHAGNSSRIIPETLEAMGLSNMVKDAETAHTIVAVKEENDGEDNNVNDNISKDEGRAKGRFSAEEDFANDEHRAAPLPWLGLRNSFPPIPVDAIDDDRALFTKESTYASLNGKGILEVVSEDEIEEPGALDAENKRRRRRNRARRRQRRILRKRTLGVDTSGNTALHWAGQRGYASMVETLLGLGADPFLMNGAAKSALDLAREGGYNDIVMRLQAATRGGAEARADFARRRKGREGGTSMVMRLRGAGALKDPGIHVEPTQEEAEWGAQQILKNENWEDGRAAAVEEGGEMTTEERKRKIIAEQDRQNDDERRKRIGDSEETPEERAQRLKEREEEKYMQLLLHPLVRFLGVWRVVLLGVVRCCFRL